MTDTVVINKLPDLSIPPMPSANRINLNYKIYFG
jgi:hypothetical protein